MILLIDNYDSFTFNLVQLLRTLGAEVLVRRNDTLTIAQALALQPSHIVLSPGPGSPENAGISLSLALQSSVPLLGVCLGHQVIGLAAQVPTVRAKQPMHGRASALVHEGKGLFEGVASPCLVGRYHSLIVSMDAANSQIEVLARSEEAEVMALRHRTRPLLGVQFHPESVLTPEGPKMVSNFLTGRAFAAR
ncbi:MAG: aminodeoxychorismate/anthranilate synthase component II [Deltaproteobacteria bacterium]|nr:aminodeoxychorismate/anthranilate synthase component II [Deltaproteobacteria bacterium]